MSALERLAGLLRAEGGAMAESVSDQAGADPSSDPAGAGGGLAERAGAGPRASGRAADYELVVEAIREGYLLHYGGARAVRPRDRDLALLAGDRLYALGLGRLVDLGDVAAVAELADVIGLAAVARAAGDPDLAEAVWSAGAHAVGWGGSSAHAQAKALAGTGTPGAAQALRSVGG